MIPNTQFLYYLCVTLIGWFLGGFLPLEAQVLFTRKMGTEDGLPSTELYSVVQDSRGYVWGASDGGLFRYNGHSIKLFTQKDGLPDNTMYKLFADPHGRIWMVFGNNHIGYMEGDQFVEIALNIHEKIINPKILHRIMDISMDEAGNLMVGMFEGPGFKVSPNNNFRDAVELTGGKDVNLYIQGAVTGEILSTFLKKDENIYRSPSLSRIHISTPEIDSVYVLSLGGFDGRFTKPILRAFRNEAGTVFFYNHNRVFWVTRDGKMHERAFENYILNIGFDDENGLIIGFFSEGLRYFDDCDLRKQGRHLVKNESVSGWMIDHEKNMWISTLTNGLLYSASNHIEMYDHPFLAGSVNGLIHFDGKVIGTLLSNTFFSITDDDTIRYINYPSYPSKEYSYFIMLGDKLYYNGFRLGRMSSDLTFPHQVDDSPKPHLPEISHEELASLDPWELGWRIQNLLFEHQSDSCYPGPYSVNQMIPIANQEMIIGTLDGIYRYKNDEFFSDHKENEWLQSKILAVEILPNGTLIAGTKANGIVLLKGDKSLHIGKENGLVGDRCSAIVPVSNTEIWVGTNNGLSHIVLNPDQPGQFTIHNYTVNHGLISNEIHALAIQNNKLWIGTRKGLMTLSLKHELRNTAPPKVELASFTCNGIAISEMNGMEFKANQNNISIGVDVLSYKKWNENGIYFRIKELQDTLTYFDGHVLTLQGLSSGHYTIEIFGANNDGCLSAVPLVISFTIYPPFWLTWWFLASLIVFISVLIWLLISWRFRILKRRQTLELHYQRNLANYQLTALRAQMNPHFIFNAFNGIQRYVLQKDKIETYNYVTKFSHLIREVLEYSSSNFLPLEKEISMLKNYVHIEQMRFEDQFELVFEADIEPDDLSLEIPCMIIQPFVENAIWHGLMPLQDKQGLVLTIQIQKAGSLLKIRVADNGIGREASGKIAKSGTRKSMGIDLTDDRIQAINYSVGFNQVSYHITDLYDQAGNSAGTLIDISIMLKEG